MENTEVAKPEEGAVAEAEREELTYRPRVGLRETADAYYLEAEMPGAGEKDVDVKLEDGVLRILGRVSAAEPEKYKHRLLEYHGGNYERSFRVGNAIDPEKVEATVNNGMLRLTLPKREALKPKRIEVKAG